MQPFAKPLPGQIKPPSILNKNVFTITLTGKTHIGLKFNPRIRLIKEHLPNLTKNQLTLKPLRSQLPRTSYLVHQGTTLTGETLLLEVRFCVVLVLR